MFTRRPLCRRGPDWLERLRKILEGQLNREIVRLGQVHPDMRKGLILKLQAPEAAPQIITRREPNFRPPSSWGVAIPPGKGAHCIPNTAVDGMQAGIRLRFLKFRPNAG